MDNTNKPVLGLIISRNCPLNSPLIANGPVPLVEIQKCTSTGCDRCHILLRGFQRYLETAQDDAKRQFAKLNCLKSIRSGLHGFHQVIFSAKDASLSMGFYISAEPPKKGELPLCDVPSQLTLANVVTKIKQWSKSCDSFHPWCNLPDKPALPRRVLDLRAHDIDRVVLSEPTDMHAPYIALSYCWGADSSHLKTTKETLPMHLSGVPWNTLPQLFQDTIQICWALDVDYLWIDAVAIIQDDVSDWEIEAARMAEIYSNSFLTISATAFSDSSESLFADRCVPFLSSEGFVTGSQIPTSSVTVPLGSQTYRMRPQILRAHSRFISMDNAHVHRLDAPLLTRAWAFQERLLGPRTLHYHAEELVWECKTSMRCECGILDDDTLRRAESLNDDYVETSPSRKWIKSSLTGLDLSESNCAHVWMDLVSEYSRLDLTYERDRLPALSGLASRFEHPSMGRYLAGMWTSYLPEMLLFNIKREPPVGESEKMNSAEVLDAPSWSWASNSLAGPNAISYNYVVYSTDFQPSPYFKVIKVSGESVGENRFSWVKDALLTLHALYMECPAHRIGVDEDGRWYFASPNSSLPNSLIQMYFEIDNPEELISDMVFVHVGGGLGLALREVSHSPSIFRRVGLVVLAKDFNDSNWMQIRQFHII